ncbi:MAG: hypothetical protein CVV02_11740 [Firmicutes bacterium HGW-Firmicutes-7]|nr:MAG: hypothetical protein CVV02_11740 [Firmicutes bacterium HGW-Firmicutes-7]
MSECICCSCKNLKSIIDQNEIDKNGIAEEYDCKYGFPSECCSECEEDGCELTCDNYISDYEEEKIVISKCKKCGKELKLVNSNDEDGEVYCVTCYLNK